MTARTTSESVSPDPWLRVLSRATATVWLAVGLLALLAATAAAVQTTSMFDGVVRVVAATAALVSLLLAGCLLLSFTAQTLAHAGFWLRDALREAWNARTPPHGGDAGPGRNRTRAFADESQRATSLERAVTYGYRCLATSLLAFVAWVGVGVAQPGWFEVVADSSVVQVAITVATFFVGVPLSAFPDVVVATGTGQPVGPDVVALAFGVLVLPSVPGVVAMANAVHYLAAIHYDAFQWVYAVATGEQYRGVRECEWTDHVTVHAVTVLCVAVAGSAVLPYLAA
jgi:hypothetical protein